MGALPVKKTLERAKQIWNAEPPRLVTLPGIVTLVKCSWTAANALVPILVTLVPMVRFVMLKQLAKALLEIVMTLLGIVMFLISLQLSNVKLPILVMFPNIMLLVRCKSPWNA